MLKRYGTRLCFWVLINLVAAINPVFSDDIVGKVVDEQGRPIGNVRVDVSTAGPKQGQGIFCPSCYLDCSKSVKTEADGTFIIRGVDPKLKFHLVAVASGKQTELTDWIDPAKDRVESSLKDFPEVAPERKLLGRVMSSSGVPVPGALVSPVGAAKPSKRWMGRVDGAKSTVTDDEGYFQMLLTEDFLTLDVEVLADGSPGLTAQKLAPGLERHSLQVPTGTSVKGRLFHRGLPSPGQPVAVVQLYRSGDTHFIKSVLRTSNEKGEFSFEYLPANEPYVVYTPRDVPSTGLVMRTARFQAGKDDALVDLDDIELMPGLKLAGRFVVPEGEPPLAGVDVVYQRNPAWDLLSAKTDAEGRFELSQLPIETYEISFRNHDWIIDETKANLHITDDRTVAWGLQENKLDLDIPLRRLRKDEPDFRPTNQMMNDRNPPGKGSQTLQGMVVDRQGEPVGGVEVTARRQLFDTRMRSNMTTNADGKFVLSQLPDQFLLLSFQRPGEGRLTIGPKTVSIQYDGKRRCELGQQGIRVVYDPEIFMTLPEIQLKD